MPCSLNFRIQSYLQKTTGAVRPEFPHYMLPAQRIGAMEPELSHRTHFVQISVSDKATPERGLYLSLRKDGRVRSSGMGGPPWALLAAQLPPEEGE